MISKGLRNCNPGNIERDHTQWQGMAEDQSADDRFCIFSGFNCFSNINTPGKLTEKKPSLVLLKKTASVIMLVINSAGTQCMPHSSDIDRQNGFV